MALVSPVSLSNSLWCPYVSRFRSEPLLDVMFTGPKKRVVVVVVVFNVSLFSLYLFFEILVR